MKLFTKKSNPEYIEEVKRDVYPSKRKKIYVLINSIGSILGTLIFIAYFLFFTPSFFELFKQSPFLILPAYLFAVIFLIRDLIISVYTLFKGDRDKFLLVKYYDLASEKISNHEMKADEK